MSCSCITYLKPCWCLALLARERVGGAQEAEHLIHHVGVVDRLVARLLHLFHHLLLAACLLTILLLSLSVLLGQLCHTLLMHLLGLCLRPLGAHLVAQLLLLRQAHLLRLQAPPVLREKQTKTIQTHLHNIQKNSLKKNYYHED